MIDAYHNFIDEMVKIARHSVTAGRIRKNGHSERTNDGLLSRIGGAPALSVEESARKSALLSFTTDQRETVARLLEQVRKSAVHDVLAHLEWAATCDELVLGKDGSDFTDHLDVSFHGDFVSRLEGYDW